MRIILILSLLLVAPILSGYNSYSTNYSIRSMDIMGENAYLVGASSNISFLADSLMGCLLGPYGYLVMSNHIVNADLNETIYSTWEKQIIGASLDENLVVLTSEGELLSINNSGVEWVGYYSLPSTLNKISILNETIFVWGRGSNRIFLFSKFGYPLGEIAVESAQAVFWIGSLGDEFLGVLYYSSTGEYRLSVLNLTDRSFIADFSVLDYYSSTTDTITYVLYEQSGSNTTIYVAAISRSTPNVVVVEAYNLSGYLLPDWNNVTLGPAYGYLYMGLVGTSLIVASGGSLWLVENGGVIDSTSVSGRILEVGIEGFTVYVFYVENSSGDGFLAEYDLSFGNISFVDSNFLGYGLTSAVWSGGDYILVFFGGARAVLVRNGVVKKVYNFLYPWHVLSMGNSTYVYSATLVYSVSNRKIIYRSDYPFSIVDVSSYLDNITILEAVGLGTYRVVVISGSGDTLYSDWFSYSVNAVSVGSVWGGLVPIGYEASERFGLLLLSIADGQFVTFDLDIRPDDVVFFRGRYIVYQYLGDKFYVFDPDYGVVGVKYFLVESIVSIDVIPSLSIIAVETVDPISTKYSYSIIDPHLGTLFTIPNTQTRLVIQNSSIVVAVYDSGYRLRKFNVTGGIIGDVYLGRVVPTVIAPLRGDGCLVGNYEGGLLLVDFAHGVSRALDFSENYEFLAGAPTDSGSVFVVGRDYALYLLDVSVWWDYEFPYLSVDIHGATVFGDMKILNGTQLKISIYSSDDVLIRGFNLSIAFLHGNRSLFSVGYAFYNRSNVNFSVEYEIPPTANRVAISAVTEDLVGRKQFFSTEILVDREPPTISVLAPNNTLSGSVDLLVTDDVGVAYVYASDGERIIPLRLVSSDNGVYVYRLSNVTGSFTVTAVDYTGKKSSISLTILGGTPNVSSYPLVLVIALLLIALFGVLVYYNRERIKAYFQRLREEEGLE